MAIPMFLCKLKLRKAEPEIKPNMKEKALRSSAGGNQCSVTEVLNVLDVTVTQWKLQNKSEGSHYGVNLTQWEISSQPYPCTGYWLAYALKPGVYILSNTVWGFFCFFF